MSHEDIVSIYHHISRDSELCSKGQQEEKGLSSTDNSNMFHLLQVLLTRESSVQVRVPQWGRDLFFEGTWLNFFMLVKKKEEEENRISFTENQPATAKHKSVCLQCFLCHFTGLKGCLEGHLTPDRSVSAPTLQLSPWLCAYEVTDNHTANVTSARSIQHKTQFYGLVLFLPAM